MHCWDCIQLNRNEEMVFWPRHRFVGASQAEEKCHETVSLRQQRVVLVDRIMQI